MSRRHSSGQSNYLDNLCIAAKSGRIAVQQVRTSRVETVSRGDTQHFTEATRSTSLSKLSKLSKLSNSLYRPTF